MSFGEKAEHSAHTLNSVYSLASHRRRPNRALVYRWHRRFSEDSLAPLNSRKTYHYQGKFDVEFVGFTTA